MRNAECVEDRSPRKEEHRSENHVVCGSNNKNRSVETCSVCHRSIPSAIGVDCQRFWYCRLNARVRAFFSSAEYSRLPSSRSPLSSSETDIPSGRRLTSNSVHFSHAVSSSKRSSALSRSYRGVPGKGVITVI